MYLYTYVSQNRDNILLELKKHFGISLNDSEQRILKGLNSANNVAEQDLPLNDKNNDILIIEENLVQMKKNVMYSSIIKEIAIIPFTIFHWSMDAIALSKYYCSAETIFYFSSLGSYCKNLQNDTIYKEIILHVLGIAINEKLIQLCNVSTIEVNSTSEFTRFFNECLRRKLRVLKWIKVDYKYSHILSINKVFNLNLTFPL